MENVIKSNRDVQKRFTQMQNNLKQRPVKEFRMFIETKIVRMLKVQKKTAVGFEVTLVLVSWHRIYHSIIVNCDINSIRRTFLVKFIQDVINIFYNYCWKLKKLFIVPLIDWKKYVAVYQFA